MPTLEELNQQKTKLREEMYQNIKGYHKNHNEEYLDNLGLHSLLTLVHPNERHGFRVRVKRIEESEL